MSAYEIHTPRNIKEAVGLMASLEEAYYVANGTKLMPLIKQKKLAPKHLISLKGLEDLRQIKGGNGLRLGCTATLYEAEHDAYIVRHYTALFDAVHNLVPSGIRKTATIGGTICTAKPSMHLICSLLLFDPDVAVAGMNPPTHQHGIEEKGGFLYGRFMGIEGFFMNGGLGALKRQELVKEFVMPPLGEHTGSAYIKVGQKKAESLGISGVGVRVSIDAREDLFSSGEAMGGMDNLFDILSVFQQGMVTCRQTRIVVSRPTEPPVILRDTENVLKDHVLCSRVFEEVASTALTEVAPLTMAGVDRWFGKEILKMLLIRALMKAIDRAIRPYEKVRPESAW